MNLARVVQILQTLKIISGGQTGVDRAALDGAIAHGLAYGGWCPQGGWAEDFPTPPGLRAHYPHLQETPSPDPAQRTEWNVRDSTATLILVRSEDWQHSAGTQLTQAIATHLKKPLQIIQLNEAIALAALRAWLQTLPQNAILNIAGPRESESPGIYAIAHKALLHTWRTNPTE
ncbi:putative molybdenum carrier protein [Thermoleptolyngbya sichuanensis]|uniref:putative molybdenum carrier protein n=1 Tax=Thermoleptolyngbya sichuanensis TaxID=2885951 RepID=UPI001CED66A8|nr:putative molybdenum carrier protein [Thermoleptolyngbya sichuanensis]